MNTRDIKNGLYGWYEKGAMKKIEDNLPFRKQLSTKAIYIAICSLSAQQKNTTEVSCFKFDIARFASVTERTVQRYLPELEKLDIIKVSRQDRNSDGKFQKVTIWLTDNNSTVGQIETSSDTSTDTSSDALLSDTYNKEIKQNKEINIIYKDIQTIIDCYQNSFNKRFKVLNDKRKKYFRGRLKNFTVEEITRSIENYSRTKFYTGENDRGWSADLDFIMRSDENIEKGLNLELDSNAKKFNQNDIPEAERIYFGEVFFNSSQFRQLKNKGLILGDAYKGWELDPLWQDKSPFEYNIY